MPCILSSIICTVRCSLVPASGNIYASGVRTVPKGSEPPVYSYPGGDCPLAYSASRDSYERLLRRLVYVPGGRIRWMTGVVTGMKRSSSTGRIESVVVAREETRAEHLLPASLVIGKILYKQLLKAWLLSIRLLDCSGASQIGFRILKHTLGTAVNVEDLRITYNPRMRYREFFFYVPSSLRHSLPIPHGYDNAEMTICSLSSSPPDDLRTFVMVRADGHRSE